MATLPSCLLRLTSVMCRLELIGTWRAGGGAGKWPGARRSGRGGRTGASGVWAASLPPLIPPRSHGAFFCHLLFVFCEGSSPLKKTEASPLFLRPNGALAAAGSGMWRWVLPKAQAPP